jgi:transcription elongation factor GreA
VLQAEQCQQRYVDHNPRAGRQVRPGVDRLRQPPTPMRVISDVAEIPESPEAGQEDETLSADSPLGLALAGHQPGDTVSYETPQGPQRVQLLSVKLPPQQ